MFDATLLALSIEALGGVAMAVIKPNTTIPVNKSQISSTALDNQPCVDAYIIQCEWLIVKDKKSLGNFHLSGIEPIPEGVQQIENTFNIDAKYLLNVISKR